MPRPRKSWQEKLADAKAKPGLPKVFFCTKARQRLVVPSPAEIESIIRRVPRRRLVTFAQIGQLLCKTHNADAACPMTTGIFTWLVAHAADEAAAQGPPARRTVVARTQGRRDAQSQVPRRRPYTADPARS